MTPAVLILTMATITNSDVMKGLSKSAGLQNAVDMAPNTLASQIFPTFEANPELLRKCQIVRSGVATNSTSSTIYTTPADRDFYLVGATISTIKDATSTSTNSSIAVIIDGATQSFLNISEITLTAQVSTNSISLNFPIKIDRNTAIAVTNGTNVANIATRGSIIGYVVDTSNA